MELAQRWGERPHPSPQGAPAVSQGLSRELRPGVRSRGGTAPALLPPPPALSPSSARGPRDRLRPAAQPPLAQSKRVLRWAGGLAALGAWAAQPLSQAGGPRPRSLRARLVLPDQAGRADAGKPEAEATAQTGRPAQHFSLPSCSPGPCRPPAVLALPQLGPGGPPRAAFLLSSPWDLGWAGAETAKGFPHSAVPSPAPSTHRMLSPRTMGTEGPLLCCTSPPSGHSTWGPGKRPGQGKRQAILKGGELPIT